MPISIHKKTSEFLGLTVGGKKHPIYKLREGIIYRCHGIRNINHKLYITYKGKGIIVCDEWKNSVQSFYNWAILSGWEHGLTIDRIDSNGNYEPSNCRFITKSENSKKARREHDQKGSNSPVSKLNDLDIVSIRKLLDDGLTHRCIAKMFNVGKTTISSINSRFTWSHI